uniref:Uncharacterized protein n=1 Tax=Anguilla anguilla TaxID=7936 RepID=A0A0E9RQM4_ANGAN
MAVREKCRRFQWRGQAKKKLTNKMLSRNYLISVMHKPHIC